MVKALKKRKIQPTSSSVLLEQSATFEPFRAKELSGQILQPVENSSRSRVMLASVRVVYIAQLAGNEMVAGENSHLSSHDLPAAESDDRGLKLRSDYLLHFYPVKGGSNVCG